MPRYRYVCEKCESERIIFHLSSEQPEYLCAGCENSPVMIRALTVPQIVNKVSPEPTRVGELTKEYIDINKQILEEEKRKAKETTHEPT